MAAAPKKTLVLLDSHAIIHRAYHALPEFASSKGVPTGALYGLTTMLLGIIEKFKPEYIVACYDLPEPTYRHVAYEAYKAGRKKTDTALVAQLESSKKIFEVFGIPMYSLSGFEADDMLGTIVEQVTHDKKCLDDEGNKIKTVIASGDMDTLQLVTGDDVVVYTLKKGIKDIVVYDELAVMERFGFGPELLPDYKGLRGDPSDNIIGIAGIGEKTATIIINTFETIENMYELLDKKPEQFRKKLKDAKITDRVIGLLENGRDDALFSKTLATIRRDAPISFNFESAKWAPHIDQIEVLFKELEFRTLTAKVKQAIFSLAHAGKIEADGFESGSEADGGANDRTGGSEREARNAWADGHTAEDDRGSFIGRVHYPKSENTNATESRLDSKKEGSKKGPKKILNKTELHLENDLESDKKTTAGPLFQESYYTNASAELKEKLKTAVWVIDSNKVKPSLEDVFFETDEQDAEKAFKILHDRATEKGMAFVLDNIELPLIPILQKMNIDGTKIDVKYLKKISEEFHKELSRLEKEIHNLAGMEFNIASPKQLGEVLYEKLNLAGAGSGKRIKKTAGGARSTKESELEKLRESHPIIEKILETRELAKLLGTYIDALPGYADDEGRVHPTFMQTGSRTGRMSSLDPSIQNIPTKSDLGKKVRFAFVAPKGKKLVAVDYSQIELRIAAFLSGDKNLIDIFKNGIDVHTGVAARVFKVEEKDVTKDMRRKAKVINFGILYGMGVSALRINLSAGAGDVLADGTVAGQASREEAQEFYSEYFNTFSGIASYLEEVKRSAAALGYTKTLFGRRRYFEGIKSHLPFIRAAAERMAINAPIQGTHADIAKLAMTAVFKKITSKKENGAILLMQIHDELVFEIDEKKAEKVGAQIKEVMEGVLDEGFKAYKKSGLWDATATNTDAALAQDVQDLRKSEVEENIKKVPILVSVSIGDSWGSMKESS